MWRQIGALVKITMGLLGSAERLRLRIRASVRDHGARAPNDGRSLHCPSVPSAAWLSRLLIPQARLAPRGYHIRKAARVDCATGVVRRAQSGSETGADLGD